MSHRTINFFKNPIVKLEEKKSLIFLPILFLIFFLLIGITGIVQVRLIKESVDEFMKNEGNMIIDYINKQININFEYLNIAEKIPSFDFINLLSYDEAIIEEFYFLFINTEDTEINKIPLNNFIVFDSKRRVIAEKGNINIKRKDIDDFFRKKHNTTVRIDDREKDIIYFGFKTKDRIVFFTMSHSELDILRKRFILKDILEKEVNRYNVTGITVYDNLKEVYIDIAGDKKNSTRVRGALYTAFFPDYTIEIYLSNTVRDMIIKKITYSLLIILSFLVITGGISTYFLLVLMKRHEKKMEEIKNQMALKERLVSLGNLASGMAHEIRNPLNAIWLSIQRLKREFMPPDEKKEEYHKFIEIMKSEIARVNRIVEDFLLSTKAQGNFTEENIFDLVDEVVMMLKEKASINGIEISNIIDKGLYMNCQKERLKQAFYNIILNGIEAIKNGGYIYINGEKKDKFIEISIKDTGLGIKKEHLEKIFDYYYTTKEKGTGIGLSIAYMIIKDHGGSIKVESTENKGSTFIITFPAIEKNS